MDLTPARWIWFPSERTLPNTFVLFRRILTLPEQLPVRAQGWIVADSRYRLTVNGQRVQWGPVPADPRYPEADPLDIMPYLRSGGNVIGVEVLYYGHGEGTWVSGKPGLLLRLDLTYTDGRQEQLLSDQGWLSLLDRAHAPGQYKRWYLRALQEEFDARLQPELWNLVDYQPDDRWLPAQVLDAPADKPAACGRYRDYLTDAMPEAQYSELRTRQIPLLREFEVPALRLTDAGYVHWRRDPRDWFEMRTPDSFTITRDPAVVRFRDSSSWELGLPQQRQTGIYATFEWEEQLVGWPYFTIDAPEGTIIEVMHQEAHDPAQTAWMDNHFYSWSRFICREGVNTFESFDFESLRWLQLHIHAMTRPVTISKIGVRRRIYDWPQQPQISCGEPALQRLFDASINTLYNSAQETCVDGMGRERQQYSGDGGHQLLPLRTFLGDRQLPRRFLNTYCDGQTPDGYFLDSWPAYDRLVRIGQRQTQTSSWGPILDHSVGFVFDTWHHYLDTGSLEDVRAPYAHFSLLTNYLDRLRTQEAHGLLPVEGLAIPTVWIDHEAYLQQRHKQCAFNLYAAAMLQHALVPLARAFDDSDLELRAQRLGEELLGATVERFWCVEEGVFINNLPWLGEASELQGPRMCDRSLATAIMYDQCPSGQTAAALKALVECPDTMGFSYPANAGWRYWALGRGGRTDAILKDFRTRWADMDSVRYNNTLQEFWQAIPDSTAQWSHCPVAPLYILSSEIVGLKPLAPGFACYEVRPQLAGLPRLSTTIYTARGPLRLEATREGTGQRITLHTPSDGDGTLLVPIGTRFESAALEPADPAEETGWQRYRLVAGQSCIFWQPDGLDAGGDASN
ncbi:hypothetical protein KDH_04510 [Dictyobacter sp. S3.2.2.5]|uniref:Alpha-L-rhamnosidase n=1 Tax=Dictyobacter halimunensis TaxID=3026934 RepID=A0ABQ6FIZ6_9CHLR|nr:hypothetical protein KDH_04510 [Dictyobacter sp. S3.2.2.5]